MASILDTGLMSHFSFIFTFLLIMVLVYAILQKTDWLKTNPGINALISLCVALLFTASKGAVGVISIAAPWFIVMFFMLFLILLTFTIFGATEENFISVLKSPDHSYIINTLVIIGIIIIAFSLASVWGQGLLTKTDTNVKSIDMTENVSVTGEVGSSNFSQNLYATLFHPKVVGLVAVLLIATFTIKYLTAKN